MSRGDEKRKHKRLPVRTDILCKQADGLSCRSFSGCTVDISANGLLVESCQSAGVNAGDLFSLRLDIPQARQASPVGGKVSAYGRVVRVVDLEPREKATKRHIAFQFCCRPEFDI